MVTGQLLDIRPHTQQIYFILNFVMRIVLCEKMDLEVGAIKLVGQRDDFI